MSWKKISELTTQIPSGVFNAANTYKRILQADRNKTLAQIRYNRVAKQLTPESIPQFEQIQRDMESSHSEWQKYVQQSTGSINLDDLSSRWDSAQRSGAPWSTLPNDIRNTLKAYKSVLQSDRNGILANALHQQALAKLGKNDVEQFQKMQTEMEMSHSEWLNQVKKSKDLMSLDELAKIWSRTVRF